MIKLYAASTTHKAWMWARLRAEWTEFEWISSWIDKVASFREEGSAYSVPDPDACADIWRAIEADVRRSDVVLCYREEGEVLRGALVECGMALSLGKRVVLVAPVDPEGGAWRYHERVYRAATLEGARALLELWRQRNLIAPRDKTDELLAQILEDRGMPSAAQMVRGY